MFKDDMAYLRDNPQGYWFKARLYGWGWTPVRWQGFVIILIYIVAIIFFALTIDRNSSAREVMFTFVLPFVLLTVALFRICYKTGEKPRWMWGPPKKDSQNNTIK